MCSPISKQVLGRRYAAMLMARAVQNKIQGIRLGMFADTPQGFYYDFDAANPVTEEEVAEIEQAMKQLAVQDEPANCRYYSRMEAIQLFEAKGEHWKVEWLKEGAMEEPIVIFEQGDYADILPGGCAAESGHHNEELDPSAARDLLRSKPFFKLLNVSGAYWQGDSQKPMLQRIYGVAFASKRELDEYLKWQEEAQKRDHRKLGKQLQLFMFADEAPGMPFYLPKGTVLRNELEGLSREYLLKYEYEEVRTPFMMDRHMWEQSGHWDHYRDNMYFSELDHHHFAVKPMNCPGHMLMYRNSLHSYKDLPIRYAEFGQVHRHEFSGALNGLFRVRTFCQDDAHIFAAPEQIEAEIMHTIDLIKEIYGIFGFEYSLELSTRPLDSMGSDEQWEAAEGALLKVLEASGLKYSLNPEDGAFYGPKIDFHIKDALHRSHQCGTIQLDFQMPEKFGLSYVDEQNNKQIPVVIHRAIYGSIDRFLGILIEHYAGAFPIWLAPVQAVVVPVAEAHAAYANELRERLIDAGIRADVDSREEKLGYRIREAQMQKVPYMLIVGDAELAAGNVQVRAYGQKEQELYEPYAFISMMKGKINERAQ
nr:threonine--tRNA ligase [Paenibacillus sp. GM2]